MPDKTEQLVISIEYYETCLSQNISEMERAFYKKQLENNLKELEKINEKEYLRSKPTLNLRIPVLEKSNV